jgi:hypothetical protein
MRRDWPLVASGFALAVVSAVAALIAAWGYRDADPPCQAPPPPAALTDCYRRDGGFDWWIGQPGVIAMLVAAVVILALAVATIRHGVAQRAR